MLKLSAFFNSGPCIGILKDTSRSYLKHAVCATENDLRINTDQNILEHATAVPPNALNMKLFRDTIILTMINILRNFSEYELIQGGQAVSKHPWKKIENKTELTRTFAKERRTWVFGFLPFPNLLWF